MEENKIKTEKGERRREKDDRVWRDEEVEVEEKRGMKRRTVWRDKKGGGRGEEKRRMKKRREGYRGHL